MRKEVIFTEKIFAGQEFETKRQKILLDGEWEFTYDPENRGINEKWYDRCESLPESISVPGCPQAGEYESRKKVEYKKEGYFESQLKYPSADPSWYKKHFTVPDEYKSKEIWLHIGGVAPAAEIWINGERIGETLSSRCAVRSNVTEYIRFGCDNTIVIRVFIPEGPRLDGLFEAHCYSAWTGLYRSIWIEAVEQVHFVGVHIMSRIENPRAFICFVLSDRFADYEKKMLKYIDGAVHEFETAPDRAVQSHLVEVNCEIKGINNNKEFRGGVIVNSNDKYAIIDVDMPQALLWSCESPNLYRAVLRLMLDGREIDVISTNFGLREIHVERKKVIFNGKPIFLRGGSDGHIYIDTVCPPASKEFFAKNIRKMKKYGFNYTKSCIEVFTKEFLDAADEEGLMVCEEMPLGLTGEIRTKIINDPTPEFADFWRKEIENIVVFDRNHPCVVAYSMTSEKGLSENSFKLINQELPALARFLNPQAIIYDVTHGCGMSVYTKYGRRNTDLIEECPVPPYDLAPLVDLLEPEGNDIKRELPWVLHEYSWWASLPKPEVRVNYEGKPFVLKGVPEFEETAKNTGFYDDIPLFVENSKKLVYMLRKEGLELARKHPGIAGYHFWLMTDFFDAFPQGLFDESWNEPSDLTPEEFRTYNDNTILLIDDKRRRCFEQGKAMNIGIYISHFGSKEIFGPVIKWKLSCGEKSIADGSVRIDKVGCGLISELGRIDTALPCAGGPFEMKLEVQLLEETSPGSFNEICHNHWNLWAYPKPNCGEWERSIISDLDFIRNTYPDVETRDKPETDKNKVIAADRFDKELLDFLNNGGRMVLFSQNALKEYRFNKEETWGYSYMFSKSYRSPAWNTGYHGNSGTVVLDHPALGGFPNEGWCDLNFVYLIDEIHPILLEPYKPCKINPIIRSIGHFRTMVDKAYMFEVRVGKGRLLATSLKIKETYETHPETRYLVESMLKYAAGSGFNPEASITGEQLEGAIVEMGSHI